LRIPHIHIGHHFFGAGNVGDDLMVAGFLQAIRDAGVRFRLTCSIPHNLSSQRYRFPEVEWLDYTPANRQRCITECDIWLGLGDSPFQTDIGMWLVGHIVQELYLCRALKKPMYFLGVGANNGDAFTNPHVRTIIDYASHIWTRDDQTAEYISTTSSTASVTGGTDLANIYISRHDFSTVESGTVAFLLHFENENLFDVNALIKVIDSTGSYEHRWLLQEVRPIPGSESKTLDLLPADYRKQMDVRIPNYDNGSTDELFGCWGAPEILITSRYHGALIGAALGSRVIAIRRNDKIKGLAKQLDLMELESFRDPDAILDAISNSSSLAPNRISSLAKISQSNCASLFDCALKHC